MAPPNSRAHFFRDHPFEPWTCVFCGRDITLRQDLELHTLDGDQVNGDVWPAHQRCHQNYHTLIRHRARILDMPAENPLAVERAWVEANG